MKILVLSAVLVCAQTVMATGSSTGIQFIHNLPAGFTIYNRPYAVSDNGTAFVGTANDGSYRWSAADGFVNLGTFSDGSLPLATYGISGDGSTVVGYGLPSTGVEAFRWTQTTGIVSLGDLPSPYATFGFDANYDGSVVAGYRQAGVLGLQQSFRWTQATGMVSLGDIPNGGSENLASAISTDGTTIVGNARSLAESGSVAYRWTQATGMVSLGKLFPGENGDSEAYDVSADGSVVIGISTTWSGKAEAFRWTQATGMVGLGDLPGGTFNSTAISLTADGSIIVGVSNDDINSGSPFIWTEQHGMRNLTDVLINEYNVDLTGWTLQMMTISADGTTFIGDAINPAGQTGIVLITIPAPTGIAILAMGMLGVSRRRR